jgi:ketosteroid isomerase-like protein
VSLDASAAAVADDALEGLVAALAERDRERVLALFSDNASVFGSEDTEFAIGRTAVDTFFTALCSQPRTYRWEWQVTAAGRDADVVWFVAPGAEIVTDDDGSVTRVEPYRLSGVLRSTPEGWLYELFNGSEPTAPG